jgi:methylmalonyl-CoA epimerase
MATVEQIAHIGIAVRELESALVMYRDRLGLSHVETKDVPERGLRVAFLQAGEALIELLAPLHEDSEISRFLDKRGEGIHHLCFQVNDIHEKLQELEDDGVRLINREPAIGAEGCPVAFLHPKSCNGVLVELLENAPIDP